MKPGAHLQVVALFVACAVGLGSGVHMPARAGDTAAPAASRLVVRNVGFSGPAAVRFDPQSDLYLVSNINGGPLQRSNSGFISRLAPDGQVRELKWIQGGRGGVTLNAPKGMALLGGKLWVADIDQVRAFDAATGRPIQSIAIPGAIALTDVAATPDGRLLVSDIGRDMASGAIFQIGTNGRPSLLVRGDRLLRPNALTVQSNGAIICAPLVGATVLTLAPDGKLLNTTDYPKRVVPPWPPRSFGRLSGVVLIDNRTALVASKEGRTVARLNLDHPSTLEQIIPYDPTQKNALGFPNAQRFGQPVVAPQRASPETDFLVTDLTEPAKIGFDARRGRILIPEVTTNTVILAPLPSPAVAQAGS